MIVVVTGLMRTGTSLISKQLHELGCPMGTKMRFPLMRENSQLDYEDVEFTDKCLAAVKGDIRKARLKVFFNQYIRRRGFDLWGVKSPFLLPYVGLFKNEAASLGQTVKVVLCKRWIVHTLDSIRNQTTDSTPIEIQKILCTYEDPTADLTVDIKDSWNSPESVKEKLMELLRS